MFSLFFFSFLLCLSLTPTFGQSGCSPEYEREHLLQLSQSSMGSSSSSSSSCELANANGEFIPCNNNYDYNDDPAINITNGNYLLNGNIVFQPDIITNDTLRKAVYAIQLFAQLRANAISLEYRATNPKKWMESFLCVMGSLGFRGITNITDNDWTDISNIGPSPSATTTTTLSDMVTPMIIDFLGGGVSPCQPCSSSCPNGCDCATGKCRPCATCSSSCRNGCNCTTGECLPCVTCSSTCPNGCNCTTGECLPCVTCSPSCKNGCNCTTGACLPCAPCLGCPHGCDCATGQCLPCAPCSPIICKNGCNCETGQCLPCAPCPECPYNCNCVGKCNCAPCPPHCTNGCTCQGQCLGQNWDDSFSPISNDSINLQTAFNQSRIKLYNYDRSNIKSSTYRYSAAAGAGMNRDGITRIHGNTHFATVLTFVSQIEDSVGYFGVTYPQLWAGFSLVTVENIDQDNISQYSSFFNTPVDIGSAAANQLIITGNFIADPNGQSFANAAMRAIGYLLPSELTSI